MGYTIFSRYSCDIMSDIYDMSWGVAFVVSVIDDNNNFGYFVQEPNHEDPLNHDAAAVLRDNPKLFESNVRRAMAGGYVGQTFFPRCI